MLHIFDPDEYEGVREHFRATQLQRLDMLRSRPEDATFTEAEKCFIARMIAKAIFAGED